jgi:hypothetical protein
MAKKDKAQAQQNNVPTQAVKKSAEATSTVHIKTSTSPSSTSTSSSVKASPPNAEVTPKVATAMPESVLVTKEHPKSNPVVAENPPLKESLTATLPKLSDEDLLKRAGDDPIAYLLRRNQELEEIITFHNALFLELRSDRELTMKIMADVGHATARLDSHALQITDLKDGRTDSKATMSGRPSTQIRDKVTGKVFKSRNATYQGLLKDGSLKELVDLGVFGDNPQKNNFGWYQLKRAFPDRFEEVTSGNATASSSPSTPQASTITPEQSTTTPEPVSVPTTQETQA